MIHAQYFILRVTLAVLLLTLVTSLPANAINTITTTSYLSNIQQSLPKQLDGFKTQLSINTLKVQHDLGKKLTALEDKLAIERDKIKIPFIDTSNSQYKLEKRNFSDIQHYSYQRDIKPVLNKKCVACHGCYDAPCQLKMETGKGLERGASKIKIYDGGRLTNLPPTRLGVDYQLTKDWREHGFYPIINGYRGNNGHTTPALMLKMLDLARKNPLPINKTIPKEIKFGLIRDNSCPAPVEFEQYAKDHPHGGMPLAITGLTKKEYKILSTWLKEGAKITANPLKLNLQQQALVDRWESWLNRKDKRAQLVSRYLYEHLFLAHLYFDEDSTFASPEKKPLFYKLIRSSTPPGETALPIKTTRPNGAVDGAFFYRLQPITDTLVNKTHIAYAFGEKRLNHYKQLFFTADWTMNKLPGYSETERGNPFKTFIAIPAKIRYQFLLDDATFFVRNFIRGPVCRGQIATDVIRDQFWIMFEDPEYERYTNDKTYQSRVNPLLGVPGQNVSLTDFGSEWISYHNNRNKYIDERQQEYDNSFPGGARFSHIWSGHQENKNAFLTIFRHYDSASIVQGWHGAIPETTWLLDYPLFERTIYELVVGFNVFGNVSHQAQTRLYFDLIRNEGETNFLRLIPAKARGSIYQHWYAGSGQLATRIEYHELDTKTVSAIKFNTSTPYTELLQRLMTQYPKLTQASDVINRCSGLCMEHKNNTTVSQINQALRNLAAKPAKQLPGIRWLPDVSFLRINRPDGNYLVYSLIRNRMHSNVAFMLGESLRLEEQLDTLTIMPTLVGSYPNLLFQVDLSELNKFTTAVAQVKSKDDFEKVITQWGIRRMNPNFWEIFHSFSQYMEQHKPLEAGIYDLNRYGHF